MVSLAALLVLVVTSMATADGGAFQWQSVGAEAYANACAACHQPNGQGLADTVPALAGHAPTLLAQPGGRDYLARLVLYGLEGQITVNGKPFNGTMPAWGAAGMSLALAGGASAAGVSPEKAPSSPQRLGPVVTLSEEELSDVV